MIVHLTLVKHYNFEMKNNCYGLEPKRVSDDENYMVLFGFSTPTNYPSKHSMLLVDKKE